MAQSCAAYLSRLKNAEERLLHAMERVPTNKFLFGDKDVKRWKRRWDTLLENRPKGCYR